MPKNFKDLVRDRQAKTGESWQTAARHVRNQKISAFGAVAQRILHLAKARDDEYDADPRRHRSRSVGEIVDQILHEPEPPHKKALRQTLLELSEKDLRKIEVLFYAGAPFNDETVHEVQRTLSRDSREVTALILVGKLRLAAQLEAGLAHAKLEGVDLDADF
jgi:hypothetical protein